MGPYWDRFMPLGGFWDLLGPKRGPMGPLEGLRGGPGRARGGAEGPSKVLLEGSWSLLVDLKTRFQPKRAPKKAPRGPQEGHQNHLNENTLKSEKSCSRLGGSVIFQSPGGPECPPNGSQIASGTSLDTETFKNLVQEGSERAPKAKKSSPREI